MPRKFLIALELKESAAMQVLEGAAGIAGADDACEIIHVIDPANIAYAADPQVLHPSLLKEFEAQAISAAERHIDALLEQSPVSLAAVHVVVGRPSSEIPAQLLRGAYDALIIGSHGYRGWQRILGTHASALVNAAPVNTWVIRISEVSP